MKPRDWLVPFFARIHAPDDDTRRRAGGGAWGQWWGFVGGLGNIRSMSGVVPHPSDRNRAVLAGFLGWTLDAFDFFLVILTSTAIARDLGRPNLDIIFAIPVTLAARP